MQMLAKSLIVPEKESLVIPDGSAKSCTKLIALEGRGRALIKVIGGVESIVSKKFVHTAVKLIGSRLSHDADLSTWTLAILRTICVAQYIEFPHCVDT